MAEDELHTSAIHQRDIDADHFTRGDLVHILGSLLEAQRGRPFGTFTVTGELGEHSTGEPAHLLKTGNDTLRAPSRYLMHQGGCLPCARFEGLLREEITSSDFGDAQPHEVMLIARSTDGELIHVLDVLRQQDTST